MQVIFSDSFKKQYRKIADRQIRSELIKCFIKLETNPELGKPLKGKLANCRCERIRNYRIIYSINSNQVLIHMLDKRSKVYDYAEKHINYNSFYN